MKFMTVCKKYAPNAQQVKLASVAVSMGVVAASSQAASLIDWGSLSTGVVAEATAAITAGVGVLVLFLGVGGGLKMFRKFVG